MGSFVVLYFGTGTSYVFLTGPNARVTGAYELQPAQGKHLKDEGEVKVKRP